MKLKMKTIFAVVVLASAASAVADGLQPIVPVFCRSLGEDATCAETRKIKEKTRLHRFYVCGPCFNNMMYGSLSAMGRTSASWKAPFMFGQMSPEFFVAEK